MPSIWQDRGYPCTFLVARSSEQLGMIPVSWFDGPLECSELWLRQREPAKEANSWFDWGGSGAGCGQVRA